MFPVKLIFVFKVLIIFNREEVVKETFEHIKLELHSLEVKLPKVTESRFRQSMQYLDSTLRNQLPQKINTIKQFFSAIVLCAKE